MSDLDELASVAATRAAGGNRSGTRPRSMLAYAGGGEPSEARAHWWACFQAGFFGGLGFFAAGVAVWVIVAVTFCGLAAVMSGVSGGGRAAPVRPPAGVPFPFGR